MPSRDQKGKPTIVTKPNIAKAVGLAGASLAAAASCDVAEAVHVYVPVKTAYPFQVNEREHEEMLLLIRNQSLSTGLEPIAAGGGGGENSISQLFLSMMSFFSDTTMGGVFVDRTAFDEASEISVQGGKTTTIAARSFDFSEMIPATIAGQETEKDALLAFNFSLKTGGGDGHFFDPSEPRIAGFTFYKDDEFGNRTEHAALMVLDFSIDTATQTGNVYVDRIVYESTPGTALPASAANVPEPGSAALAMLAAGAAGLAARRRTKQEPESVTA